MSGTNVWTRSRERMRRFPELFAQCSGEAAAYGKCVTATTTGRQELRKDLCVKEFDALKTCIVTAVSGILQVFHHFL
ncbi:NADH dehydrogenase [ubiquinone] 1 alpha subcomplex assembly factor 8 isoform X1 [Oncorhynchus tshawytscha]|uniref:NADH dehydrogenase [ubiquinone] 1 alpha subcomplex assembly factor 8 isoform X1 n=1 Tax=Oncorhynchus tshawytscha TaxID=74940 RepID=UPI000D09C56A|nr:NADH dehydrogenase [ubiquinone] 1 alpha subcomplex assembly factor 8 isoform X1 [Oncorhynchus tshawytscha]